MFKFNKQIASTDGRLYKHLKKKSKGVGFIKVCFYKMYNYVSAFYFS